jgi:putative ABC transport system substrate-binding protein
LYLERVRIAATAAAARLPTVSGYRDHVEAGGLISYGVDLHACLHRGDLRFQDTEWSPRRRSSVELPTKLELAINMKAAKELGIAFPTAILVRADRVTE